MFPRLGLGVGIRSDHYSEFIGKKPGSIAWGEVISENFMGRKGRVPERAPIILEKIREQIPIVLHGVSLSIASSDPIDQQYLKQWKVLIERIEPVWVSDHLCWTGVDGINLHDLLPVPYTAEALHHVVERIRFIQDFLGRRILIENVSSYLEFANSEMPEWEFISEVANRSDCGILLDVNNIYVSSFNHRFDPKQYIKAMPKNRIGQIHLAGHSNFETHLVDTHDHPICEEVWALYRWTIRRIGSVSTMIERDENIPSWNELEKECLIAKKILDGSHECLAATRATAAL